MIALFLNFQKQVNLIINDRVIRYAVTKKSTLNKVVDYGEKFIDVNIIEDGKIINQKAFQSVLERLVRDKKWKRANLFFTVHDASVTIREQMVPKGLVKEEIKQYIFMELEENIRLPFTDPVLDFAIIGEEEEQTKILLFAYPKDRLQPYISAFEKVGLKPKVADFSALSIYRLYFELDMAQKKEHLLMVQWRIDAVVLTAFYQQKPIFTRYVKSTLNQEDWTWRANSNALDWTGEKADFDQNIDEQLVTIERFLDFYRYSVSNGEEQITKILLTGELPVLDAISERLQDQFNLPVVSMRTLEQQKSLPAKYADVLGLVLKPLHG